MLKNRTKFIIAFIVLLFGICLLNTNTVQAVEVTEEQMQQILDLIPNEMKLDIPEVEYEKANNIVANNIKNILKSNNIEYIEEQGEYINTITLQLKDFTINDYNIEMDIRQICGGLNINEWSKAEVSIQARKSNSSFGDTKFKNIKQIYNNHSNYNTADETYVKNLKIENPKYFEEDINLIYKSTSNEFEKMVEQHYNKFNNKDIVIKMFTGQGGLDDDFISQVMDYSLAIFKNGILYDFRNVEVKIIPMISIPKSINNEKINDYVIKVLKDYNKDIKSINNIAKGATIELSGKTDIKDGYTVKGIGIYNNEEFEFTGPVVIRKEVAPVTKTDTTTNIKLEADTNVVPANTVLKVAPIIEGQTYNTVKTVLTNVNKLKVFDINLLSNGVKIQPNGKVKISIPIPTEFDTSKLAVYRIADNGEKIKYNVTVENNNATFETDHFSTYVLAEETTEVTEPKEEVKQGEKDNTPKTGINNMTLYILGAVALIIGAGITTIKKYNK